MMVSEKHKHFDALKCLFDEKDKLSLESKELIDRIYKVDQSIQKLLGDE